MTGPFQAYAPPNVYVQSTFQTDATTFIGAQRLPLLIGVGQEELEQTDVLLVRGSSTSVDQQIVDEDVSASWVVDETNPNNPILGAQTGLLTKFRVKNYPIVDGGGFGTVTNDVKRVIVTVNGTPVSLAQLEGAKGFVTLAVPTQPTDIVRVTYFMHRGDTAFTDDVSLQVTTTAATLISPGFENFNIVAGSSDTFSFKLDGVTKTLTLIANPATTAAALKSQIDAQLYPGLTTATFTDSAGRVHLQLTSAVSLEILDGNANGPLGWAAGTATSRTRTFRVFNLPITDGLGGGLATTDPSKVVVKVNNVQVVPTSVDGQNGTITLPSAPAAGSTVTIAYWSNTWQDTFDYLPNAQVTSALRCGISPGRSDYISGADFVLENIDASTSVIHWGASKSVTSVRNTSGSTVFDSVQIVPTLVDDRLFLQECSSVVNTNVIPAVTSTTEFLLPAIPTMGNGRDTPLSTATFTAAVNGRQDLISNRPDLIIAYAGRTLTDALTRSPVKVIAVDGSTRKITLQSALPPDHKVYATFWFSRLTDDEFLLTCKTPGPVGVGTYEILSTLTGANLFQTLFGTKTGLSDTVQWPRGNEFIPDAYHTGDGTPVNEIVTVTFGTQAATTANFTNRGAQPYNLYNGTSNTWAFNLSGNAYSVNLNGQSAAYLVGDHIEHSGGTITVPVAPGNVFNFEIDGVSLTANITSGVGVPIGTVVNDINTVIDAHPTFAGTAPNNLCGFQVVGADLVLTLKSYSTPAALPGGFDHVSKVRILSGTVEGVLGFTAFQTMNGTTGAINKPATLLGTVAGPFNITAGVNDLFDIRIDGVDYSVTIPNGAPAIGAVVAAINAVTGGTQASAGTLANANKLRLTSATNTEASSIVIVGGTALAALGFTQGDTASQVQVKAEEIVDRLMFTVGVPTDAAIKTVSIEGNTYINIETTGTGTLASVSFTSANAFNVTGGLGITAGVDGDVGDASHDNYVVTSTHPQGSTGTGIPGQTFTASATGLRFTVLPASDGSYTATGFFTLIVSQTFKVHPTIPTYACGGTELTVSNTVGVGVDDVASLKTFNPSGLEPKNGDVYYLSYRYLKQDFTERYFRQFKALEANFGPLDPSNALTLGGYLAIQNGAPVVACKQVRKATNSGQASDVDFSDALNDSAILAGNLRPNLITCLASSTTVASALTQHCEVQSNPRNQSERTGMIGFASGTTPSSAQSVARGLRSQRIMAIYPDTASITLTNELGENFQTAISGIFLAAAVLGSAANPSFDVATPYTRRRIVGIDRLLRSMEPTDMDNTAAAGITVLVDNNPVIQIRHGLTTNMSNVLTQLPTVTQVADYNAQGVRQVLDGYIGSKNLKSRVGEIQDSVVSFSRSLIQAEILSGYGNIRATPDPDPTTIRVSEFIAPIFPLLYIPVEVGVRSQVLG